MVLFFEIDDLAVDENGNRGPAGLKINLGNVQKTKISDEDAILIAHNATGFDVSRIHPIPCEYYYENYEDEDDDLE